MKRGTLMSRTSEAPSDLQSTEAQRAAWRTLPAWLFVVLAFLDTALVAAYFVLIKMGRGSTEFFAVFNLDKEGNLPSWYAGIQLFIIAAGYLVLGSRLIPERRRAAMLRPLWWALGIGFVLLSADEVSSFHERMGRTLWRLKVFNVKFVDQWMVLYLAIGICFVLVFGRYLVRAARAWPLETLLFVLGFGVLASGAFAAEMAQIIRRWAGARHLIQIGIEEWLELFGATILVLPAYRVLSYVMSTEPEDDQGAVA